MKRDLALFLIILTCLILIAGSLSSADKDLSKIDKTLAEELNTQDNVKVIIELNKAPNKAALTQTNPSKLSSLAQASGFADIRPVKEISNTEISTRISLSDLSNLLANKNIKSIKKPMIFHTALQGSVVQINASQTWALKEQGANLTGKGQTVCIIDTGVNYTHESLGGCYGNNSLSSNCKVWGGIDLCADDTSCDTIDSDPMDVNGHGTHVTGIVSANKSIKGVAPDSRVIMIKAANSSGAFSEEDIVLGINWCVNNASKFNISVISLSLGAGDYSSYCDSDSPDITSAVNAAVLKNISRFF